MTADELSEQMQVVRMPGYQEAFKHLTRRFKGSVTGLHYDSKYFRIAKENGELCMVSGSLNITMICIRFS